MHCFGISFSFTKETHLYEEKLTGMFCSLLPSSPGRDEESIPAYLGPPPTPGTWRLHLLAPPGTQPGVGSAHLPGGNRTDMRTGLGFEHQHVGECDREREGTAARRPRRARGHGGPREVKEPKSLHFAQQCASARTSPPRPPARQVPGGSARGFPERRARPGGSGVGAAAGAARSR